MSTEKPKEVAILRRVSSEYECRHLKGHATTTADAGSASKKRPTSPSTMPRPLQTAD